MTSKKQTPDAFCSLLLIFEYCRRLSGRETLDDYITLLTRLSIIRHVFFFPRRMDFIIRHFAITGWKRVLYAFIFILLCWQLSRFWGNWKDGVSSVFYVIHAPIHEIGHTVAAMIHLPEVVVVLAGSLFQLLTPIVIGVYFVWHGDCPAISLCLGWLGFATIEMATYMHDAPFRNLPLVAPFSDGDNLIHDFEYLFTRMHCLDYACRIGVVTAAIGYAFVFISLALIIAMLILGFLPQKPKEE